MIDLYYAATPNGLKVKLLLEEVGVPYKIIPINLQKGEQPTPMEIWKHEHATPSIRKRRKLPLRQMENPYYLYCHSCLYTFILRSALAPSRRAWSFQPALLRVLVYPLYGLPL